MLRAFAAAFLLCVIVPALARDPDNRYAESPNRDWFKSLQNQNKNYCCDGADGLRLEDPEWEFNGDAYRVKLDGDWLAVDPSLVVKDTNRVGYAVVWPYKNGGKTFIRCFMPGSGT